MFAVATLLYGPKYLPGALVLGHVLRKFSAENVRFVALIEKAAFASWQLELLREVWDELIDTRISESSLSLKLEHELKRPELAKTYTKIELWRLPFEKVLYLDADVLPLDGDNRVTDLLKLNFPRGKILAASDSGFPDIFNSGVFALTPDQQDYNNLSRIVLSHGPNISFDGADQGLLNQYFNSDPDWVSKASQAGTASVDSTARSQYSNWIPIPFLYNTTPNAQYQYYPALNHFGYPVSGQSGPSEHGSSAQTSVHPLFSQAVSVSPYGDIPLVHFSSGRSRSQVSVLHFIGASKPWDSEHLPVFEKWWQQWYEYSRGKPVEVVMRGQKFPISIHELSHPSAEARAGSIIPADLCDPSNYQHLQSNVTGSSNFWDATKEAPPLDLPDTSNFDLRSHRFSNEWDDYDRREQEHRALKYSDVSRFFEPSPPKNSYDPSIGSRAGGKGRKESRAFGVHEEQVAERVFDESSNYAPRHLLMMTDPKSLVRESRSCSGKNVDAESVNGLERQFSKVDLKKTDRSRIQENAMTKTSEELEHGPAKIFPWEFRGYKPERVWD